jgi:hypothetical protein
MLRIGIKEAAAYLDREPGTLRKWERDKVLPDELLPARDDQNRRYWTQGQLDTIKQWLVDTDRRPGKGLKHYKPSPEKLAEHLRNQRGRKKSRP